MSQKSWPFDDDGDVFRELQSDGFDFNALHEIDFDIDFESWPLDEATMQAIEELYPTAQLIEPEAGESHGYVEFTITSELSYDLVMQVQEQVSEAMKPYGGWCASWGVSHD